MMEFTKNGRNMKLKLRNTTKSGCNDQNTTMFPLKNVQERVFKLLYRHLSPVSLLRGESFCHRLISLIHIGSSLILCLTGHLIESAGHVIFASGAWCIGSWKRRRSLYTGNHESYSNYHPDRTRIREAIAGLSSSLIYIVVSAVWGGLFTLIYLLKLQRSIYQKRNLLNNGRIGKMIQREAVISFFISAVFLDSSFIHLFPLIDFQSASGKSFMLSGTAGGIFSLLKYYRGCLVARSDKDQDLI